MKVLLVPVEAQKKLAAQKKKQDSVTDEERTASLIRRIIRFAKLLRINKIPVHTSNERDAIAALAHIDINSRFEFYIALRANMIMSQKYRSAFDILFLQFWRTGVSIPKKYGGSNEEPEDKDSSVNKQSKSSEDEEGNPKKDSKKLSNQYNETDVPTYSLGESMKEKDFELITPYEMALFDDIFRNLKIKLREKLGRRFKPSNKGKIIDLRRSIRQSTQRGGEIMNILTKDRKPRQTKLVLIADVSGSMDVYSRFLIKFIYGMQKHLRDTETFAFGTKLMRISDILSNRTLENAMTILSQQVQFWSGGTDLGGCFAEFNRHYGGKLRKRNRILVILSDGWDKGDPDLLKKQMTLFKRGFRKIIWLNPNLKYDRYEPLCLGMSTAMPFIDHFLPCHNLKTLEQFIDLVKNI
ncbi:MAG: VWA domain-containing protein [Deltaproteobacteria bacterium]|nr:VWA domain-containing protein [Deltaproteobacteria bacterium]